jgi:hypothetical protein
MNFIGAKQKHEVIKLAGYGETEKSLLPDSCVIFIIFLLSLAYNPWMLSCSHENARSDAEDSKWSFKGTKEPDMVAHSCNPSTPEAKAGGLQVWGQLKLQSETLPQNKNKQTKLKKPSNKQKTLYTHTHTHKHTGKKVHLIMIFIHRKSHVLWSTTDKTGRLKTNLVKKCLETWINWR